MAKSELRLFFDDQRRWTDVSPELATLLGYSCEELIGRTADELLPPDKAYNESIFRQFLEQRSLEGVFLLQGRDGVVHGVRAQAFRFDDGCMGAVLTLVGSRAIG